MPALFWTDVLFFLLLAMLAALLVYARDKEHLRRPWHKVATNRSGMVSLVVLLAFLLVGVLDCLHFYPAFRDADGRLEYKTEAISVFDWCTMTLSTRDEKTYSAPFAAYAYAREYVRREDGSQRWEYPRLQYGGAHLENPQSQKLGDIVATATSGAGKGLLLWSALCAVLVGLLVRQHRLPWNVCLRRIAQDRTQVPWRAMLITLLIVVMAACVLAELSVKYHVLGTDKVGQDVFYQSLKSVRTGLIIGTLTTMIMLPFALLLGILAGYFRGWVDDVIQYVYTTLNSIPDVLLIAAAILMMQVYMAKHEDEFASLALRADLRLLFLCLILGITRWTGLCRLLRAETLKLREMEYIQAAKALGVGQWGILVRHILPNVFHIVLITVTLDFSALVLAEAVLSYINIGVDPTTPSWGNMINSARLEMAREPIVWWSLTAAFLFMFTLVLAANLFADVVRDALDPRREANNR